MASKRWQTWAGVALWLLAILAVVLAFRLLSGIGKVGVGETFTVADVTLLVKEVESHRNPDSVLLGVQSGLPIPAAGDQVIIVSGAALLSVFSVLRVHPEEVTIVLRDGIGKFTILHDNNKFTVELEKTGPDRIKVKTVRSAPTAPPRKPIG